MLLVLLLLVVCLFAPSGDPATAQPSDGWRFKGMTVLSWSYGGYQGNTLEQALLDLRDTDAEWVGIIQWWFMEKVDSTGIQPDYSLYSYTDENMRLAIQMAKQLGFKVMLKPHVDVKDDTWRGLILPHSWQDWFSSYGSYILHYADMAEEEGVELFTIGTELQSSQTQTSRWLDLIGQTRERYHGEITYAANWWPGFDQTYVGFWDQLDYIGVDGYFPLTNRDDPTANDLMVAWTYSTATWFTGSDWIAQLREVAEMFGKQIVFTEIGYRSIDGANRQPWDWQTQGTVDLQEQADCYHAALEVMSQQEWFAGFFWWYWLDYAGAGGPDDQDFTPQNKPAEDVIRTYYTAATPSPTPPPSTTTTTVPEPTTSTTPVPPSTTAPQTTTITVPTTPGQMPVFAKIPLLLISVAVAVAVLLGRSKKQQPSIAGPKYTS